MGDRKNAERFERAWNRGAEGRARGADPYAGEPEEVRQALEMGEQLARTDLSSESQVRESLRKRLLTQPLPARAAGDERRRKPWGKLLPSFAYTVVTLAFVLALAWSIQNLVPNPASLTMSTDTAAPGQAERQQYAVNETAAAESVPVGKLPEATGMEGGEEPEPAAIYPADPVDVLALTPFKGRPVFAGDAVMGRLAYVRQGQVWVQPFGSEEAVRLTEQGDFTRPRWSTSGRWLAFREGARRLWVAAEDGSGYLLEDASGIIDYDWSPASEHLALTTLSGDLLTMNLDTPEAEMQMLVSADAEAEASNPAWSPDGEWLAYEGSALALDQGQADSGLWKVPSEGGEAQELYRGPALLRGWTGDGAFLVFWQTDEGELAPGQSDGAPLALLPAGGGEASLVRNSVLPYDEFVNLTGNQLGWLALITGGGRETWTNKAISLMGYPDPPSLFMPDTAITTPAWSPDGERLVFAAMPDPGRVGAGPQAEAALRERHLYVVDLQEGKPRPLTTEAAFRDEYPQWSVDGRHILFVRLDEAGRVSLWYIPAVGGDPYMLVYGLSTADLGLEPSGAFGYVPWSDLFDWWQP